MPLIAPAPPTAQRQEKKQREFHAYGKLDRILGGNQFLHLLETFEGEQVHLFIEVANRRTNQANRYYWGMLNWLSQEIGEYPENIHAENKKNCNTIVRYIKNRKTGKVEEIVFGGDTKHMKVGEFQQFVERCRVWWAERGYAIPDEYWEKEITCNS